MPQNVELEIKPNQSVMDLAHKNGIFIKTICNGVASCSECRVKITEGEYNVLPPAAKELLLIGSGYFIDQRRLSCQLTCFGDVAVDLTEQIQKQQATPKKIIGNKKLDHNTSQAVSDSIMQQEVSLLESSQQTLKSSPPSVSESRTRDSNADHRSQQQRHHKQSRTGHVNHHKHRPKSR